MTEQQPETPSSARRGLLLVAVLALICVGLLVLIVRFAERRSAPPPPPAEEMVVIPAKLNIRSQPSAKSEAVEVVTRGQRLQLLEDAGAWVRVSTPGGTEGWAERSALEKWEENERRIERTAAIRRMPALEGVVSHPATLFAGPGIFYPPLGEVKEGAKIQIYTRDHDFYAVEAGDGIGYIEVDAVDVSAAGGAEFEVASRAPLPQETVEPDIADAFPEPEPTAWPTPDLPVARESPAPRATRREVYMTVPAGGTPPRVIDQVAPRYPAAARRARAEGRVVLRAVIRSDGSVGTVDIVNDLPYGLGDAAREAVRQWRFRPAEYRGEAISVYYTVTVNFRLTG